MGSDSMRVVCALLLLLLCYAPSRTASSDVVVSRNECAKSCTSFLQKHDQHTQFANQACGVLCQDSLVIGSDCLSSLLAWAEDPDKGLKALSASENPIEFALLVVSTLEKMMQSQAGMSQATAFQMQSDLKFVGHYDRCLKVPDAHYCHTALEASMEGMTSSMASIAFCVPRTCSEGTITALLQRAMNTSLTNSTSSLPYALDTKCGDQTMDWEAGTYVMVVISSLFAGLALLAVFAEFTTASQQPCVGFASDVKTEQSISVNALAMAVPIAEAPLTLWCRLLECFSPTRNYGIFCSIRSVSTASLDGMRSLSMSWVVLGHALVWPLMAGLGYSNIADIIPIQDGRKALMATWTGQAIQSAEFSVDSFFYMSGFLAVYIGLKKLAKLQPLQVLQSAPVMVLDRWLRLTPLYMFVVWLYVFVVPTMQSAPYWQVSDAEYCREYWWQNILYVNTIFLSQHIGGPTSGGCYGVSWYLADDMMFFISLVPLAVALTLYSTRLGLTAISAAWLASVVYTLVAGGADHWSAATFDISDYQNSYYMPPWTRCPPYLMGAAFGIIWHRWHTEIIAAVNAKLLLRLSLFLASGFLLLSTMYGLSEGSTSVPSSTPQGWMTLYVALSKSAWTLGLIFLNVLCFSGCGGPIRWVLERPLFGYMGKLSYSMYLLHPTVLVLIYAGRTTPEHFSIINFTCNYIAALSITAAGGFVLHLFVELPSGNLVQLLMSCKRKPKAAPPPETHPAASSLDEGLLADGAVRRDTGEVKLPV